MPGQRTILYPSRHFPAVEFRGNAAAEATVGIFRTEGRSAAELEKEMFTRIGQMEFSAEKPGHGWK